MKFKGLIFFFIIFILLVVNQNSFAGDLLVFVNGKQVNQTLKPIEGGGSIVVGARQLTETIGAELKWYKAISTLEIIKDDNTIKMMVDSPYIQVNNRTRKVNTALKIINGQSYVSLKEVVESFGFLYEKKNNEIYITKPETLVKGISWKKGGQQLLLKMDKLAPYRINKTDNPKEIVLELDKAALATDFKDELTNKNFYLKINKVKDKARLQFSIISNHIIPFKSEVGIGEDGDNLLINFLPQITGINWTNNSLIVESNGKIEEPTVFLLQDPRRMIIDIPDLMLSNYDLNLPENNWIKNIRVSQFKYDPVTLRIVLELREGKYLTQVEEGVPNQLVFKPAQINKIRDLEFKNNSIRFLSSSSLHPDIFALKEPDRLVINLLNTVRDASLPDKVNVSNSLVTSIRTGRFNEETVRIVVDLKQETGHKWQQKELSNGEFEHIITLKDGFVDLKLADSNESTDISIGFNSKVNFQLKKYTYPDRLVIDVEGDYTGEIANVDPQPVGDIKDIRISTFKDKNIYTRFVFELKKLNEYRLFSSNPADTINISLLKEQQAETGNLIVIDPGHGGFDPGAIGSGGLMEKDVNLSMALLVRDLLVKEGYDVLLTRDKDVFISLMERVNIANRAKARLFVSIHNNSSNSRYSEGTETFIAPNKVNSSKLLAEILQDALVKNLKRMDRGMKSDNFYVLKHTSMPAALVEVAFLSNAHEEALLDNTLFKEKAVTAITKAIKQYLGNIKQGADGADD